MVAPNIHIHNLSLSYHGDPLFFELNLSLPAGKWVALLGPSGVGKSSLLRMIAHLTTHHGDIVADNGIPVSTQVAYMAQTDLLLPWMNVLDNTLLGFKLKNKKRKEKSEQEEKAKLLLEKVGLNKSLTLYPHQLSGGMRQRVALVRTLMENKPIILMDEPFSALDAITRYKLQALAAELLKNKTVIFITHDPLEALRLANEIYVMQGRPATIKSIAELNSATPRDMSDPYIIALQTLLFAELTQAQGCIA